MKQEIKERWVAALRDPEAKQVPGVLTQIDETGKIVGQCCMGVLCELAVADGVMPAGEAAIVGSTQHDDDVRVLRYGSERDAFTLPYEIVRWAELPDGAINPVVPHDGGYRSLGTLNDAEGLTFPEIADAIEGAEL